MSSGFTNTFILEANRLSSEEVKSGNLDNPALFTNKVNNGLKLNTGDVVGVHSAYISELGAEGSDIEIKGVNLDTLNASQILTYNEPTNRGFEGSIANENVLTHPHDRLLNRFPLSRRVEVNERINYRDDEINMVMNPYKNANGEYYITLPYRYSMEFFTSFEEEIKQWERPYPIINLEQPDIPFSSTDSTSRTFGNASNGNITRFPNAEYNYKDFREYYPKPVTLPRPPDPEGTQNGCLTRNIHHDNSRYAIYQLENCIHLYPLSEYLDAEQTMVDAEYLSARDNALRGIPWDPDDTSTHMGNASYQHGLTHDEKYGNKYWRDIATFKYVRVKNKVNCSVTAGYNTNQDIANKISEDMLRTQEINTQTAFDYNANNSVELSVTAENQVNKLYNCATIGTFDEQNWKSFNDVAGRQTKGDDEIFHYIEAWKTIGVKRPDLYDLGRAFSTKSEGYKTRFDFYTENAPTNSSNACGLLYTDIPWSKVGDLKKLVDAQHRYPELFDVNQMNAELYDDAFLSPNSDVGSAGFLHINRRNDHDFLGYDLSDNNASYWGLNTSLNNGDCPTNQYCSVPIFFDINASTRDMPEGIHATGSDWEHAVYGFAVKVKAFFPERELIGLRCSGVYQFDLYTDDDDNDYIPEGTHLGWDYHFTAYGCPCMLLWNGFCNFDGVGYQGYGISQFPMIDDSLGVRGLERAPEYINKIYLGSPDIEMEFDNESDRFQILKLHRSEVIGNLHNAGYEADDLYSETDASGQVVFTNPDDTAVPKNDNAAVKVYKLNKQLTKTNFTPSMAPYFNEMNASFYTRYTDTNNACYTAKQIVEYTNNNFTPQAIFDSQCGNYIVDWGMNEKYWNDSLWGIMGFRYSQTSGSGNSQTRVINSVSWGDIVDGMDENTTNADITNADFDSMTRNLFNVETYGLTPPIPQIPRFEDYNNSSHTYAPPISITQVKGQPLRALEIPTRTLRPYYTIRSNIIGQSNYFGGSESSIPLPVVAVVEKVSQSGDFFNLSAGRLQFTITQPTMLTDITTSIHDPDGSYSIVSPNSAVLYQVQRQVQADMNVVSTILQGDNKKQAQEFEEQLAPKSPTKKDISDVINQMKS